MINTRVGLPKRSASSLLPTAIVDRPRSFDLGVNDTEASDSERTPRVLYLKSGIGGHSGRPRRISKTTCACSLDISGLYLLSKTGELEWQNSENGGHVGESAIQNVASTFSWSLCSGVMEHIYRGTISTRD